MRQEKSAARKSTERHSNPEKKALLKKSGAAKSAAPLRAVSETARCPHEKRCGGCSYSALPYAGQLRKKQREADIELVRDLIIAVDRMNRVSKDKSYEVNFYASVRTDVIDSVLSNGYEINKCTEDYGVTIEWYQRGGNYVDNPLLKLLEKKVNASEKENLEKESNNVWGTYFEQKIHGIEIREFLLKYSWYRPRDIIRMMTSVQDH